MRNFEAVHWYGEKFWKKFDEVIRSLEFSKKHIEKYIDEKCKGKLEN